MNFYQILLHQLLLGQELQDVFALIALQLDDLSACMRRARSSEKDAFELNQQLGSSRRPGSKAQQARKRRIPPWQGRKTHLA